MLCCVSGNFELSKQLSGVNRFFFLKQSIHSYLKKEKTKYSFIALATLEAEGVGGNMLWLLNNDLAGTAFHAKILIQ